jgi:hypothetical protein
MTVVKHRSAGATTPQGGGRAVALAILCTLLFLTFLDNTIVSVGPSSSTRSQRPRA